MLSPGLSSREGTGADVMATVLVVCEVRTVEDDKRGSWY